MDKGSVTFSPSLKAGVGHVGEIIKSTFLKTLSKSRLINSRTFAALR